MEGRLRDPVYRGLTGIGDAAHRARYGKRVRQAPGGAITRIDCGVREFHSDGEKPHPSG